MYLLKSLSKKAGLAIFEHKMILEDDKILICFSGGKDSFALIKILENIKKNYPINFELKILVINPNFDNSFERKIMSFLKQIDLDYEIINTKINEVIDKQSKIKKFRPCFMCSRLRRGIIYDYAIKNNYNKIALGHTLDDAIITHLMNFFYSSKTSFLKPKYLAENKKVEVIRPLIYIDEDLIKKFVNKSKFIPTKNECPLRQEDSNREHFKKIVKDLKQKNPKIKENAYHALKNTKELNPWN